MYKNCIKLIFYTYIICIKALHLHQQTAMFSFKKITYDGRKIISIHTILKYSLTCVKKDLVNCTFPSYFS